MSLFKKPSRKFKQRSVITDSDEENESFQQVIQNKDEINENSKNDEINQEQSSILNLNNELKEEKTNKNIKLSFEEDEDVKEFKVKRSLSSIKALKQLEKKKNEVKKVAKKIDLNSQTKSIRKMMESNKTSIEEQESLNKTSTVIAEEIDIHDIEECDFESESIPQFRKPKFNANSIPDIKTIEIIKRKRFLAKDSDNDLISLIDDTEVDDDYNDEFLEGSDSRLIRDDPLDKETIYIDDDNNDLDDDRVDFCVDKTSIQKEKIKAAFFNAQNEEFNINNDSNSNDNDSDNEIDLWEKEQIKKGVSMQQFPQKLKNNENFPTSIFMNSNKKLNELPNYIKTIKPALTKEKLLIKYKEELHLVNSKIEYLENQFTNIDLTINNIKDSLSSSEKETINLE